MNICWIGDSLLNIKKYDINNIINYINIDSITYIKNTFYIDNPKIYNYELIQNIIKYDVIILSLFSNDIRDKYYNKDILTEKYFKIYEEIISILKKSCDKLLIIYPHKPYLNDDSNEKYFEDEIHECYEIYYKFIIKMSKEYIFSILDLNKTFDYNKRDNYIYNCHLILTDENNIKIIKAILEICKNIEEKLLYYI